MEGRGRGRRLTGARMKIPVNGTTGSRRPGTWRSASKDSIYPTRYVNGKKDGQGGAHLGPPTVPRDCDGHGSK